MPSSVPRPVGKILPQVLAKYFDSKSDYGGENETAHFAAIYESCSVATMPSDLPFTPNEWWQGLLMFLYFTGWRISEPLLLSRKDIDLEAGVAITRHTNNKGKADSLVRLHPLVVEHLRHLDCDYAEMFPWVNGPSQIYSQFRAIQRAAGIELECIDATPHKCNETNCKFYGFHDVRRAFATVTGADMTADELRRTMRHKALATTQAYINARERALGVDTDKMRIPTQFQKSG